MYGVFIADDEKWVRQSIKNSICWEENDFEIIGESSDGIEAMEEIIKLKPCIVFSDIRMPGMDGIELFKNVKAILPNIIFIFISGYSSFDYVQDALILGAFSYILKPLDSDKLLEILQKAKQKVKDEEIRLKEKCLAGKSFDILKNQFFTEVLKGVKYSSKEIKVKVEESGISPTGESFLILNVSIDSYRKMIPGMTDKDMELLVFSLMNISEEIMTDNGLTCFFIRLEDENVIIINFGQDGLDEAVTRIFKAAEEIVKSIKEFMYYTVTIGVGSIARGFNAINESYMVSRRCLGYRLVLGNNRVIREEDCRSRSQVVDLLPFSIESILINTLETRSYDIFSENLDKLYDDIVKSTNVSPEQIMLVNHHIISLIYITASRRGLSINDLGEEEISVLRRIDTLDDIETMKDEIKSLANRYVKVAAVLDTQDRMSIVKGIKNYVYKHYNEKINLQVLASKLYMHPVYLSKVFKDDTGENFTVFILNYRMNIAKSLMKDMRYDLADIANMVGYDDYTYFNKAFRKLMGVSPAEFRKKYLPK